MNDTPGGTEKPATVASEEELRLLIEGVEDYAMFLLNTAGEVATWNRGATRIFGWSTEEVVGQPYTALYPVGDVGARRPQRELEHAANHGKFASAGWRRRKDSSEFWATGVITPLHSATGGLHGYAVITRDLTEQYYYQQALRENESRLAGIIGSAMDGIISVDGDQRITMVNVAAENMFGYFASDLIGQRISLLIPGPFELPPAAASSCFQPGTTPAQSSGRLGNIFGRRSSGDEFPIEASASLIEIGGRKVFTMILRDITERVAAEEKLRRQEEDFRQVVETIQEVFWIRDAATHQILYVSPSYERIWGRAAQILYDSPESWLDSIHPSDRARVQRAAQRMPSGQYEEEYRIIREDGQIRWIHECAFPIVSTGGIRRIAGASEDITRRKEADRSLRLQSAALNAAANSILITDRCGVIEWVNGAFTTLTGYSFEEAVGKEPKALIKSDRQDDAFYKAMWQDIIGGRVWRGELVCHRKDGTLYDELMTITPLRDEHDIITHFIAIQEDISERNKLQAQILRNQRLESVGRLAGGIAHDLNNILVPMLISPPLLRAAIPDPTIRELVDTIESGAKRGAEIIRQLLTFSRGADGQRLPVQFSTQTTDMAKIVRETFPKNIKIETENNPELWLVNADPTQMHQVLMNLCVNAADAMPEGGTLRLSCENVQVDGTTTVNHPGVDPGRYVLLSVNDNGKGISPDHLDQIFDPFFSTKAVGQGTGLGLSTVLGIVIAHRGFIQVDSVVGKGTTFKVYLPSCNKPAGSSDTELLFNTPRGENELVLIVDDEESVRRVARRLLERNGYRVLEACDGESGIATIAEHQQEIRAVLADYLMPGMGGQKFLQVLREADADVRVIVISGHLSAEGLPPELNLHAQAFIPKPFTSSALLQTLHRVLHPQATSTEAEAPPA